MKLSKKTRRLMAASVGASALMACATATAQEPTPPSIQLDRSQTQKPSGLPAPSLQQVVPKDSKLAPKVLELPAAVPQCTNPPMVTQSKLTPSALDSIFKNADANKDGVLSPTEFQSAYQKIIEVTTPKMPVPVTTPAATLPERKSIAPCPYCGLG